MSIFLKYNELDERLFNFFPQKGWLISFMDSSIPIYRIINTERHYIEVEILTKSATPPDHINDFNTAYNIDFELFTRAGFYWNIAYGYPKLGDIICFIDQSRNHFEVGEVNFVGKYTFDITSLYI